jgi:hypothetical protein
MKCARLLLWVVALAVLSSCNANKPAGTGPHATVLMRDGTSVAGTLVSSSSTEVEVLGDDQVSRRIPMSQVRSIDYGEAPPAAAAAPATLATPPAPATSATPPAPASPAARRAPAPTAEAVHDTHYHPSAAAITTKTSQLAAGTRVSVRTEETIDSSRAVPGQTFASEVSEDVLDDAGNVVIPRGANAQIVIKSASKGGRFQGQSDLVLDLASVSVDGRQYQLDTRDIVRRGEEGVGKNKRTAEYTGGGAAIGALIGAIAGKGKGAAIGAGAGAGAGALAQAVTRGDAVRIPAETVLTFRLDSALKVVAAR